MPEIEADAGAQVIGWLKRPGDTVRVDEPLCRVAWGEHTAEISSPATGVVRLHCVGRGASVTSGDSLGLIDTSPAEVESSPDLGTMAVAINTSPPQLAPIQT